MDDQAKVITGQLTPHPNLCLKKVLSEDDHAVSGGLKLKFLSIHQKVTKFWVLVIFLTEQMIFFDKLLICIFLRRKCQALKPYSMLPGGGFSPYGVDMFSGGVPGSGLPSPAAYANSHASQFSVSNNPSVQQFWVNIYKLLFQKP